jgi:tRNA-specific 2-thiouridylase
VHALHYARNQYDEVRGRWILSRPADKTKDQTYFLFGLTQEQLARTLFPLGEMQKPAVRVMAGEAGLEVAGKPDSQEICFIPGGDYQAFLRAYLDEQEQEMPDIAGELVTSSGEVVGRHTGIHNFTVGQRKGLGLTSANPLYVLAIHPESHQVTVGADEELMSREVRVNRVNWISVGDVTEPMRVMAKVRHRHEPRAATLTAGAEPGTAVAIFDEPQRAITPGQAAIFYQEDEVVGGGWIY